MNYNTCTTWEEIVKEVARNYEYSVEQEGDLFYIVYNGKRETERYKNSSDPKHIQETFAFSDEIKAWAQAVNLALMNLF